MDTRYGVTLPNCWLLQGTTLAACVSNFLCQFQIPTGLKDLPVAAGDVEKLTELASTDPCQTNPVPLSREAYKQIFEASL